MYIFRKRLTVCKDGSGGNLHNHLKRVHTYEYMCGLKAARKAKYGSRRRRRKVITPKDDNKSDSNDMGVHVQDDVVEPNNVLEENDELHFEACGDDEVYRDEAVEKYEIQPARKMQTRNENMNKKFDG